MVKEGLSLVPIANPILNNQIMEGYSFERILSFLNGLGFNFTNERGLVQHCRDGRNLLKVAADIIKQFEPSSLRSILATECHRILDDIDRHRESLPTISELLVVKEVLRETGFDCKLVDYIHAGGKEQVNVTRMQAMLSHLLALSNWNKQIQNGSSTALGKLKLLEREARVVMEKMEQVGVQLAEVERVKVMERPNFEANMRVIAESREELARCRAAKNEMNAQKGQSEKILIDSTRDYQEAVYHIQERQIALLNAQKELSINAPEVRKEKLRQDAAMQEAIARQQRTLNYLIRLRELMDDKGEHYNTHIARINGLTLLDVAVSRDRELKAFADRLKNEGKRSKDTLRGVEDGAQSRQRVLGEHDRREETEGELIGQFKARKTTLRQVIDSKHAELRKLADGLSNLIKTLRNARNDADEKDRSDSEIAQAAILQVRRMEREFAEWQRKVDSALQTTHQPFNLGLFQQEGSPYHP